MEEDVKPKVFISYCWDGQSRKDQVVSLVQRLAADGIDSVVDLYDLNEGDDKYHFMEKMVTDQSVSHVLVICDKKYSDKAHARTAGVGTESQIISQEIYTQVSQSKFIPLIYEFNDVGEACTPIFFKSRIYIDFSTPENENKNWERLIRLLYGKPELVKPELGKRPAYLNIEDAKNIHEMDSKFRVLKSALMSDKNVISIYRDDFLESCFKFIDDLRIKVSPQGDFSEKIISDFKQLVNARNFLVDWCLLECKFKKDDFPECLLLTLERLLDMASRPEELTSWNDNYFYAHKAFVYETFFYIIAALIKSENFTLAHDVFTSHYKLPITSSSNQMKFCNFTEFYFHSNLLQDKLAPPGRTLNSPLIELFKIHANRDDLKFQDIMQADLIAMMFILIKEDKFWYPQTLLYCNYSQNFPLFIRATQHKNFQKLLTLSGEKNAVEFKEKLLTGIKSRRDDSFGNGFRGAGYAALFNLEQWDTLK